MKTYRLSVDSVFLKRFAIGLDNAHTWASIALSSGATVVKIWYNNQVISTYE